MIVIRSYAEAKGDVRAMLDDRKSMVLRAVINAYTDSAIPVGSSVVASKSGIDVSPATVRNDMAFLEAEGYLEQPHTSAGRVPTEKGYRHFVDHLDGAKLQLPDKQTVASFFSQMRGEIEEMLRDTAGLLSNLTDHTAVVVDTPAESIELVSLQLVSLHETTVLLVLVFSNGQVSKHTLELTSHTQDEVAAANLFLQNLLQKKELAADVSLQGLDARASTIVRQCLETIANPKIDGGKLYVDGASHVVNAFEAVESVGKVLQILEQQLVVATLLADIADQGVTVAIGTETGVAPLSDCSLVVSPYNVDGEHSGAIAVLGPTRMNYPQAMSAVAAVSRHLENRLSEG